MNRLRIYTASKLAKADFWKELEETWDWEFEFHARWPKSHVGKVPDSPTFAKHFWMEDEEDVRSADVLLIYGAPDEVLRGALVEAGMAIAFGIPVICVGENPGYGTWRYHAGVYNVVDFDEAKVMLTMMASAKQHHA